MIKTRFSIIVILLILTLASFSGQGSFADSEPEYRWEGDHITISPHAVESTGGIIVVSTSTSESGAVIEPITFKIMGPDYEEIQIGAQVAWAEHTSYISRAWSAEFNLPANRGTDDITYRVTVLSPKISGSLSSFAIVKGISPPSQRADYRPPGKMAALFINPWMGGLITLLLACVVAFLIIRKHNKV